MSAYAPLDAGRVTRFLESYNKFDTDPAFTLTLLMITGFSVILPLTLMVSVWFVLGFLAPLAYAAIWTASRKKLHYIRYDRVYANSQELFNRLEDPSLESIARPLLQEVWNHSRYHPENHCTYCITREELIKKLIPSQEMNSSAVHFARDFLAMQKEIAS